MPEHTFEELLPPEVAVESLRRAAQAAREASEHDRDNLGNLEELKRRATAFWELLEVSISLAWSLNIQTREYDKRRDLTHRDGHRDPRGEAARGADHLAKVANYLNQAKTSLEDAGAAIQPLWVIDAAHRPVRQSTGE